MRHKVTVFGSTNRHGITTQDVHNAFTITITRLVTPEDEDIRSFKMSVFISQQGITSQMTCIFNNATAETSNLTTIYIMCSYALNLLKQPTVHRFRSVCNDIAESARQGPSPKDCNCSDNHGIPYLLQNLHVHYHIHKIPQTFMQMQTFCAINP